MDRTCLMSSAGKCSTSFNILGDQDRFMCQAHWRHVPDELRQKLVAEFAAVKAAHEAWQQTQQAAIFSVLEVLAKEPDVVD